MSIIPHGKQLDHATSVQRIFTKNGALVANDFAGQCVVGSLAIDYSTPGLYQCSATDGSTTSTWQLVSTQV